MIFTALALVFLIPMVGLAIDAGLMYAVRARLAMAVDAAALGSARTLAVGSNSSQQQTNAIARAQRYFDANFPNGLLGTTGKTVSITFDETQYKVRKVTVSATVNSPAYFTRILGWGSSGRELKVSASGQASRRDVNVMLVLDRSGSLETAGACDDVENAAVTFVDLFANGRDRVGLISFGGSDRVDYAPIVNFKDSPSLSSVLSQLDPGGCSGGTGSAQALWHAYQQLVAINEPGALNVIVFFTDGQPNTLTADWPVDTLGTSKSHCYDWVNSKYYYQASWNPVTEKYRGYIAKTTSGGLYGLMKTTADSFPFDGTDAFVTNPIGYTGAAKSASDDCYWRSGTSQVGNDIAYIPNTDTYGNSIYGYKTVTTNSGGSYPGKAKLSGDNLEMASINAVDNAAARIRQKVLNPDITTVIYCIGLGGTGEAEETLLRRIANDSASPIYDNTAAEGIYIYSPTPAQLNQAFVRIASEVLRFSQ
ncbi:MAG: VWA domain-containing protein [Bryobacterales bacterium]|nr:VWA domain-containing protein [Bryobacterales bacterium]